MQYGICNLSIVPIRREPSDFSELVSQLLYGELFKILERRKNWVRIRMFDDGYEGWIDIKQYKDIPKEEYKRSTQEIPQLSNDIVSFVYGKDDKELLSIPLGSRLNSLDVLEHNHDGTKIKISTNKTDLIKTALYYLNSPFLWGGKTPFGIDCSGFTQMVYKLNGQQLLREASMQASQGDALSFIEESEPGDLAFFDNSEGEIVHVGLIMEDNYVIHSHGRVRIDRLDHSGIYDSERGLHTHRLRVIKKIV